MKTKWLYTALCVWLICVIRHSSLWYLFPLFFVFLYRRQGKWFLPMALLLIWFQWRAVPYIPDPPDGAMQITIKEIKASSMIAQTSDQKIIVYGMEHAGIGDTYQIQASCKPLNHLRNFAMFDFTNYYQKRSIYTTCHVENATLIESGNGIRTRLWNHVQSMEEPYGSILKQLLFGIQEEEEASYMIRSSGLHLSFLASQLRMLLMMFCTPMTAGVLSLMLITGIGAITVWKESLARLLVFRFLQILYPTMDRKDQLGISMLIILGIYPYIADELCFVLPVMFRMVSIFQTHKRNRYFTTYLVLIPIQFYYMQEVNLLNILLFPLLRAIYAYSYLGAWLLCLFPHSIVFLFIQMLWQLAKVLERSWLLFHYQASIAFLFVWFYFVFRILSRNRKSDVRMLLLLMLYTQCFAACKPYLEITMIDVGQGDCILIMLPFAQGNILIDAAGSETRDLASEIIVPILKAKGIETLDLVIITHDDMDHSGSLSSLQQQIPIARLITEKPQHDIAFGNFTFQFLLQDQTFADKNDNSLIVYFHAFDMEMLFMGDAGAEAEHALMREYPNLHADLLKVAHHGSKTASTQSFLHQIHPTLALISCGANNRYGHPHKETIHSLRKENVTILNSAKNGAVSIKLTNFIRFYKTMDNEFGIISSGD